VIPKPWAWIIAMPILAIEDDAAFAELLRFWLAPREIRTARTMHEAEAMIAEISPRVLILDLALPDSAPDETIAKIEELKKSSDDATVIVITGHNREKPGGADQIFHKHEPGFFEALDRSLVKYLGPAPRASEPARMVADEVRQLLDPGENK